MTENIRDPFAEIESRQVADWKNFLVAQPDALETAGASSATIRQWEDIPDVASFPSTPVAWIAEGLIPAGAITLLAGEPGSYKTWSIITPLMLLTPGTRLDPYE